MAYSSLDQLTDRFGERTLVDLTDRAVPATGVVDEAVVTRVLADTDAMIDGYLASRYKLPLAATPPLVADLAATIAIYKLHRRAPDQKIADDYHAAIRALRDIAAGTVRLDVAGVEPEAAGTAGVTTTDRDRDMTPDNLKGFI